MTTLTLFHLPVSNRIWAFTQMGIAPRRMQQTPGLTFYKLMGSGRKDMVGLTPNFGVYALLCVWTTEAAFRAFWSSHPVAKVYQKRCDFWQTAFLEPIMAHGQWDGTCPFEPSAAFDPQQPVAVLTRATIRLRHLRQFWRYTAPASADVHQRPGLRFAIGVGELPVVQQATFSLWDTGQQMLDFAYKNDPHNRVIRKTRELGWYKEEMFARFAPVGSEGSGFF